MDDPQQRYWRSGSQIDRDMFANSSLMNYDKQRESPMHQSSSNGDIRGGPTPLDLSLQRDVSATKWSQYAPMLPSGAPAGLAVASSPIPKGGPSSGFLGVALKAAGKCKLPSI